MAPTSHRSLCAGSWWTSKHRGARLWPPSSFRSGSDLRPLVLMKWAATRDSAEILKREFCHDVRVDVIENAAETNMFRVRFAVDSAGLFRSSSLEMWPPFCPC